MAEIDNEELEDFIQDWHYDKDPINLPNRQESSYFNLLIILKKRGFLNVL